MKRRPLTDAPERLNQDQRMRIRAWATQKWPKIEPHLGRHWSECRDWHLANGVMRADFEAAFRNWLRKANEFANRPLENRLRSDGWNRKIETERLAEGVDLEGFRKRQ